VSVLLRGAVVDIDVVGSIETVVLNVISLVGLADRLPVSVREVLRDSDGVGDALMVRTRDTVVETLREDETLFVTEYCEVSVFDHDGISVRLPERERVTEVVRIRVGVVLSVIMAVPDKESDLLAVNKILTDGVGFKLSVSVRSSVGDLVGMPDSDIVVSLDRVRDSVGDGISVSVIDRGLVTESDVVRDSDGVRDSV